MKIWQSQQEKLLFYIVLLMAIGAVNILSASFVMAEVQQGNSLFFMYKYGVFAGLGLLLLLGCRKIPYKIWLGENIKYLTIAVLIVLLLLVKFVGLEENGAKRWLLIGSFSLQPSELVKIGTIIIMSSYLGPLINRGQKANIFSAEFLSVSFMAFLVYKQPDLGTAAIIWGLALAMMIVCGLPRAQLLMISSLAVVGAIGLSFAASYRAARIKAWLDPWSYQTDESYQAIQSFLAIGSGGVFGEGAGQGVGKFFYLPEAHTDFAFAIFCQEWGFVGACILILAFVRFAVNMHKVAMQTTDGGAFMLVVGTNMLITGQALGNLAMVTGLLPVIGVPLPFISYGGTSMLSLLCFMSVTFNVIMSMRTKKYTGIQGKIANKKNLHK